MILGHLYEALAVGVLARQQERNAQLPVRVRMAPGCGHLVARLRLPGYRKSGIAVRIHGQVVEVNAVRRSRRGEEAGPGARAEAASAERVSRRFELPQRVDAERAEARYRRGVLSLRLPVGAAPGEQVVAVH